MTLDDSALDIDTLKDHLDEIERSPQMDLAGGAFRFDRLFLWDNMSTWKLGRTKTFQPANPLARSINCYHFDLDFQSGRVWTTGSRDMTTSVDGQFHLWQQPNLVPDCFPDPGRFRPRGSLTLLSANSMGLIDWSWRRGPVLLFRIVLSYCRHKVC